MYAFTGATRSAGSVRRYSAGYSLESALRELLRLLQQAGGPGAEVERRIAQHMEAGTAPAALSPTQAHIHLALWLRVRDLHRFVLAEEELRDVKLAVLGHVQAWRTPAERWQALRPELLRHLPRLCPAAGPYPLEPAERYKQALSRRGSPVGRLLVLAALFNFDSSAEAPPENLTLRFRPGAFPEHAWEVVGGRGASPQAAQWEPADPLCRWEYLAADLAQALQRGAPAATAMGAVVEGPLAKTTDAVAEAPATLYCQFAAEDSQAAAQLPLFPLDSAAFLPELQRRVHRALGAEGLRLLALVLAQLARGAARQVLWLDVAELTQAPGLAQRTQRERARKLLRVLRLLEGVALHRVSSQGGRSRVATSQFLTVLARHGAWSEAAPGVAPTADPLQVRLGVLVDGLFFPTPASLGTAFLRLPPAVLATPSNEHPYVVALALALAQGWPGTEGVLRFRAGQLLHEAGLWVPDSGRYRAVEQLKRDLRHLQELGVLGRWRLQRGATRDVWEDEFRLEAPRAFRSAPQGAPEMRKAASGHGKGWAWPGAVIADDASPQG